MRFIRNSTVISWLIIALSLSDSEASAIQDSVLYELAPIEVTALRFPQLRQKTPFSVTSLSEVTLKKGRQQLSLRESLNTVPGLYSLNTYNFAQDLRLSIRGFGAKSSFGIRGIKVLIDGIPETTPDGQTQLDNLNLNTINSIEVIRSPAHTLYGNSSAGVILISTQQQYWHPSFQAKLSGGSYGIRHLQARYQKNLRGSGFMLAGSYMTMKGFRQHSRMESFVFDGTAKIRTDSISQIHVRINIEQSPVAEDPGSLTRTEANGDPAMANPANIRYNAGEAVLQTRIGLTYDTQVTQDQKLGIIFAYNFRSFENSLPFEAGGIVNLHRHFLRMHLLYSYRSLLFTFPVNWQTGIEAAYQRDGRKRFDNLNGVTGALAFDQLENYANLGWFLQQQTDLSANWQINLGLRYDYIPVKADDYYENDGSNSGSREFKSLNMMAGSSYQISPLLHFFTNISSGFETPSLLELSNNPEGIGGFNPNLEAQRLIGLEAGFKGTFLDKFQYELALYSIKSDKEFVPYELAAYPGRTFFRNAGQSRHRGIESALNGLLLPGLSFAMVYTYSDFHYIQYMTPTNDYAGKTLPGIPMHYLFNDYTYSHPSGFYGRLEWLIHSKIYTNDENLDWEDAQLRLNLQGGYRFKTGYLILEPYAGINNIFDRMYSDNLRINAFGKRYFEPAPPRNFYIGLTVNFD